MSAPQVSPKQSSHPKAVLVASAIIAIGWAFMGLTIYILDTVPGQPALHPALPFVLVAVSTLAGTIYGRSPKALALGTVLGGFLCLAPTAFLPYHSTGGLLSLNREGTLFLASIMVSFLAIVTCTIAMPMAWALRSSKGPRRWRGELAPPVVDLPWTTCPHCGCQFRGRSGQPASPLCPHCHKAQPAPP